MIITSEAHKVMQWSELCKDNDGSPGGMLLLLLVYSHLSGDFGGSDALILCLSWVYCRGGEMRLKVCSSAPLFQ